MRGPWNYHIADIDICASVCCGIIMAYLYIFDLICFSISESASHNRNGMESNEKKKRRNHSKNGVAYSSDSELILFLKKEKKRRRRRNIWIIPSHGPIAHRIKSWRVQPKTRNKRDTISVNTSLVIESDSTSNRITEKEMRFFPRWKWFLSEIPILNIWDVYVILRYKTKLRKKWMWFSLVSPFSSCSCQFT